MRVPASSYFAILPLLILPLTLPLLLLFLLLLLSEKLTDFLFPSFSTHSIILSIEVLLGDF
ncbi:hypothetical protein GLOIN_2v1556741 [Rhizophagus irregularis DAOM 181602=DAOM 197198]|uniref:Uncharacterized protein n=1 Tax=Rhizophagus irregularis (strain DAOM 181602 / DAOM 197198 / MUCL 43194) TaxID=747089 RepID=A0A2P4QF83_RHIID|nr:hypothetical protein GLOIN_2v1556741 [Rhizophagus irregularis DAOM 181602=DAOM 197198]POG76293.1 hypothetical protein GLOIN_2v1556741 [Rhizophagus irregularis DAOM 181602=DAOM 197198]|eukprot:XP_025183159.1 hypothetical protein GLOIN_2v1556741 [Rhizophagus irregularis DAOM 181602=DAOM 197198]